MAGFEVALTGRFWVAPDIIVIGAIVAMVQPLAGQSCCGDPNCMLREIYSPVLVGEGGGLVGQTLFKLDCPPGPGCGLELEMFDAQGNPITEAILNGTTAVLPSNIQLDSGETDIDIITSPRSLSDFRRKSFFFNNRDFLA